MRRCVLAVGLAMATSLTAAPLSQARRPNDYSYEVRHGRIDVTVRFRGDGSDVCQRTGLCRYAGTVRYILRAKRSSSFASYTFPLSDGPGIGFVGLWGGGSTTADVSFRDASGNVSQRCTDSVPRPFDALMLVGGKTRVEFLLRGGARGVSGGLSVGGPSGDTFSAFGPVLDTRCAGPLDADVVAAGAIPSRSYAASRFRRRRFNLVLHQTRPFRRGGFVGTARTVVRVVLKRVAASFETE